MADRSSSLAIGQPPVYNLNFFRRLCYGVGHVLNDLCASMWFSYLLVFFHKVLMFSNQMAGYVMLLGQVSDAVCTPFIGYETDRTKGCGKYGQRKTWHLLGCICVLCSFPFIFLRCPGCEHADDWAQLIYYAPFVVIFQFGWASTQISHLSLIPELTPNESERVELNAIRYAFTVISSITVYAAAWLFLGMEDDELASSDAEVFRNLAIMVIGLGLVFVVIFHVGTKEHAQDYDKRQSQQTPAIRGQEETECTAAINNNVHVTVTDWLKEHQFYQVALVYMFTRLTVNLSQIYMPMYLTDSLLLPKNYIAIVPLVVYISGFLTSLLMKIVNRLIGRKLTYIVGAAMVIGSGIWFYFLTMDSTWHVIFPAILLGAGNSTILVTSLSILADLIGNNTSSGAFVYGSMSFVDKLSNGIAVVLIQNLQPCPDSQVCCADCVWYYRDMMAFVPSSMALLGIIGILTMSCMTIGDLSMFRARSGSNSSTAETERLLAGEGSEESECCSYWSCFNSGSDVQARVVTSLTASGRRGYGTLVEESPQGSVHRLSHDHISGESVPGVIEPDGPPDQAAAATTPPLVFLRVTGMNAVDMPPTPPPSLAYPVPSGSPRMGSPRHLSPSQVSAGLSRLVRASPTIPEEETEDTQAYA